jgi:hypothetical protein
MPISPGAFPGHSGTTKGSAAEATEDPTINNSTTAMHFMEFIRVALVACPPVSSYGTEKTQSLE